MKGTLWTILIWSCKVRGESYENRVFINCLNCFLDVNLGTGNPFSLQFSDWKHMSLLIGLGGHDEDTCRSLKCGDIKVKMTSNDLEYIEDKR